METKKEKNLFQEAYPLQQKVFKFHNVSKDVILGNKKVKKDVKRKAKKLPPDKIQRRIEESQEKMAELILKQYIPIRQKRKKESNLFDQTRIQKFTRIQKYSLKSGSGK